MKLKLDEDIKMKLEKMREILAGVKDPNMKPIGEDPTLPPGCGHYCMVTCSYYCEDTCAESCKPPNNNVSSAGCAYKYVDPCGYYNTTYG